MDKELPSLHARTLQRRNGLLGMRRFRLGYFGRTIGPERDAGSGYGLGVRPDRRIRCKFAIATKSLIMPNKESGHHVHRIERPCRDHPPQY